MPPSLLRPALIASLATTLLAGCAGSWGIRRSVADDELQATKKIGLVSVMNQDFHMFHLGYTVFGNEKSKSTVDWDINGHLLHTGLDMLKANTALGATVFELSPALRKEPRFWTDPALWTEAGRQGLDHLVVLMPSVSQNNQLWDPGVGFYESGLFGGWRCVYAGYTVNVFSVATHEIVGWQWATDDGGLCRPKSSNDIPYRKNFDDYSADEKALIHARLDQRLTESLEAGLRRVGLLPERKD